MSLIRIASHGNVNKVAVITGASAGVGRATAREFARRGYRVGLIARGLDGLLAAKAEIERLGSEAHLVQCDVSDPKQVEEAAEEIELELGAISVWVNDAMVSVFAPVEQTTPEEYRRVTEVTYLGYVHGTLAALKRMRARNKGVIIQVGSALAYRSIPLQSAYCAAKHAVNGFTESLRTELLHDKCPIQVVQVHLPAMNTPQFAWSRAKLPNKPKPVAPIFQPEVAARAIVHAALHPRRELSVGFPTVVAILGEKIAPGFADRYLAQMGYAAQQTESPKDPGQSDNLYAPVPGDAGAHGSFDAEARGQSLQLWLNLNRGWIAGAVLVGALIYLKKRGSSGKTASRIDTEGPISVTPPELPLVSSAEGAFAQGHLMPETVTLFRDWTRLTSCPSGEIQEKETQGYFVAGTRMMTHYRLWINDEPIQKGLTFQASSAEWSGLFTASINLSQKPEEGTQPEGSVEVRILRKIDQGWSEKLGLRNYDSHPRDLKLRIAFRCPVDDIEFQEEMKQESEHVEGLVPTVFEEAGAVVLRFERSFGYRKRAPTDELARVFGKDAPRDGQEVKRALEIRLENPGSEMRWEVAPGELTEVSLHVRIGAKAEINLGILYHAEIDGKQLSAESDFTIAPLPRKVLQEATDETRIRTGNSTLNLILGQARQDLKSLELSILGQENGKERAEDWLAFNAGIPRYVGIFSRDILTTAWQSALFTPKYMEGALRRLALYRGVKWEAWRDEEPNRIPHEARLNPLSAAGRNNRELYYGDVASTPFWIVTLAAAYNWTGERRILLDNEEALHDCCTWIRRKLEEGDGLIYYAPAIPDGKGMNRHHAWKDSDDAVVDAEGAIRVPPLAAAEIQGYCYLALLASAEITLALGHPLRARRYLMDARALKLRFNERFWMPEKKFYAFALDREGSQIDGVVSNIGHCLGTGLIDEDKLPHVAKRLLSKEMFSGWGIRTLSSDNPAYDPFSYHRGSVWPVENATIAAGLALTGFATEATSLISAQLSLASLFPHMRLPEVLSGHERGEIYPTPGIYPDANLLQAWSVSAISLFIQVLVGIRAFAPLRTLLVKPILPAWLPWVEIENLRVGKAKVSLRFWRDEDGKSHWKILGKEGVLWVLEQPTELDPSTSILRRIQDAFRSAA